MGGNAEDVSSHISGEVWSDGAGGSMSRFEISLLVILFAIWVPGLLQLAEVWRTVESASHRFLIPFVALWAATAHRAELAMLPPKPIGGGRFLLEDESSLST